VIGRRGTIALLLVLACVVALPLVGRWERARWLRSQNAGIAEVRREIGSRFGHPDAYRDSPTFECLIYKTKEHPFARELCFDPSGAVVEAIERTPNRDPKISTVRPEPGAASVRVDPVVVARLLDGLGAQTGTVIQTGKLDLGPTAPSAG
jgi:hypothetical protein